MLTHVVFILFVFAGIQSSYPLPYERTNPSEAIQILDTNGQQFDLTSTLQNAGTLPERSKRTIGILRDLFPELTKQIDDSVNKVVSQIIRVVGPAVLRGAVRNRNSPSSTRSSLDIEFDSDEETDNAMSNDSGARVSVELPTIPPSVKKEDLSSMKLVNDADDSQNDGTEVNDTTNQSNLPFELNAMNDFGTNLVSTVSNEAIEDTNFADIALDNSAATDVGPGSRQIQPTLTQQAYSNDLLRSPSKLPNIGKLANTRQQLRGALPQVTYLKIFEQDGDKYINLETLNALNGERIRISRQALDANASTTDEKSVSQNDETGSKDESNFANDISLAPEFADDDNRNKRFLLDFGGQAEKSADSGNFLFDVIRLFSSSAPTQTDANDATITKATNEQLASPDGYTEAIPGPVTRLFVLANRGLSNLIQDLILRIAQTSERVVNFKARIITALI